MEYWLSWESWGVIAISVCVVCAWMRKRREEKVVLERGERFVVPRGSWGWPLIGETLEFIASGYTSTPVSFMEKRKSLWETIPLSLSLALILMWFLLHTHVCVCVFVYPHVCVFHGIGWMNTHTLSLSLTLHCDVCVCVFWWKVRLRLKLVNEKMERFHHYLYCGGELRYTYLSVFYDMMIFTILILESFSSSSINAFNNFILFIPKFCDKSHKFNQVQSHHTRDAYNEENSWSKMRHKNLKKESLFWEKEKKEDCEGLFIFN